MRCSTTPDITTVSNIVKKVSLSSGKSKKTRADKYGTKLAINGTFADVIKASVISMLVNKKVLPKKDKKKK